MKEIITSVFVYGTLKEGRPLDRSIFSRLRTKVEDAETDGAIYSLGSYPAVRLDEEGTVVGELHTFSEEDIESIIAIMDGIEGYSPGRPEDRNLYNRRVIKARSKSGEETLAYIYEFGRTVPKSRRLEDGVWEPGK